MTDISRDAQFDDALENPQGRVLIIAGSDPSGGAGIQADIKTVTALGGYASTAITALTVQNTTGVQGVHDVPCEIIAGQIEAVLTDIGTDAIKTGMLANTSVIESVLESLDAHGDPGLPFVVDPVMVATSGDRLLDTKAIETVKTALVPRATLLTPNAPEAAALTGIEVEDMDGQRAAGEALIEAGARAVLVKGGHIDGGDIIDVLVTRNGVRLFTRPRLKTRHTHGTGCTLASACAAFLAQGLSVDRAVEQAGDYLHEALQHAPGFGKGAGPVGHGWTVQNPFGRT